MEHPFWTRTQSLLKVHKISHENFARLVGINYNTFRCWKYNNRIPDAVSACDMANALGVTVEYLVKGKDQAMKKRKIVSSRIKKLVLKLEEEISKQWI